MAFFLRWQGLKRAASSTWAKLRQRQRLALPLGGWMGGMIVPIGIYLAINAGRPTAIGWAAAMSTDTAFALGMLALVGWEFPTGSAPIC